MANVLKVKRGLKASIPTLAAGELAMTTDTFELFGGTGSANKYLGGGSLVQELINPRLLGQSLCTYYGGGAAPAPYTANSTSINVGRRDFTAVWRGCPNSWKAPSGQYPYLLYKYQATGDRWAFYINHLDGKLCYYHAKSGTTTVSVLGTPCNLIDGTEHELAFAVTRETATATGKVEIYIDGVYNQTLTFPAVDTVDLDNTGVLYTMGNASYRCTARTSLVALFNRALSAVDVMSLYRNGIADGDRWGVQVPTIVNDMSSASGWTLSGGVTVAGGVMTFPVDATSQHRAYCTIAAVQGAKPGRYWDFTYEVISNDMVTAGVFKVTGDTANKLHAIDITLDATVGVHTVRIPGNYIGTANVLCIEVYGAPITAGSLVLDNMTMTPLGCTMALEPHGLASDRWYDSSSNANNMAYPATGWELVRKAQNTVDGNFGIGTRTPLSKLHVVDPLYNGLRLSSNETPTTVKYGVITGSQYDSAIETEGMLVIGTYNSDGVNRVYVGGGYSEHNAAQAILFYTTAAANTRLGTVQAMINGSGNMALGSGLTVPRARLHIVDSAFNTLRISSNEDAATAKYGTILASQYDSENETEGFYVIGSRATDGVNKVCIGGSQSINAATAIEFYTALDAISHVGALRMSIAANGTVEMNNDLVVDGIIKAATRGVLAGDTTGGRVLRHISVIIENGTNVGTVKASVLNTWNGDAFAAQDNLVKGVAAGNLLVQEVMGYALYLQDGGITGSVVDVLPATILSNSTGTPLTVSSSMFNGGIAVALLHGTTGANIDLTTLVDSGTIKVSVAYMTSA